MKTKELKELKLVNLAPHTQKSFSGNAKILVMGRERILFSYETPVLKQTEEGDFVRLWDGWSQTTGRHIKAFCGLNKAGFMALPTK